MRHHSEPGPHHNVLLLRRGFPERPDAVAIADEDGELLAVNDTFLTITGCDSKDLVGRSVFDLDLRVELEDGADRNAETLRWSADEPSLEGRLRNGRIGFGGAWLNLLDGGMAKPDPSVESDQRREMERIREVLEGDGLSMVFQPIVDLRAGRIVGVEALARFLVEPRRRPDVWFTEARVLGLGLELQLAAAALACEHLWEIPGDTFLSVNISGDVIASPALRALLEETDTKRIVIEITEHEAIEDYAVTVEAVERLREMGVRLAVDDVGAGFASLRHLLRLRPDLMKLDTSLCRHLRTDPGRALAEGLVSFATASGASVVVEGIETPDELDAARTLDVDLGQGFLLATPEPLPCLRQAWSEIESRALATA